MIYYITGLESRSIKIDDLMKEFNNISSYDASLDEYENFASAITSSSLFSDRELIILKRANKLKKFSSLLDLLSTIKDENKHIVIDYFYEFKNKNPYIKDFKKLNAEIINIEKDEDIIHDYIEKELKINKVEAKKIIDVIGTDYYMVKNEIQKYKVFLGKDTYSFEKIEDIMTKDRAAKIYYITQKILLKNISFNDIPKSMYFPLIYSLQNEFQILHTLQILDLSLSYEEFRKQYEKYEEIFNANYYVIYLKNKNYRHKYTKEKALKILNLCLRYENEIKIGNLNERTALWLIISEVSKNE